LDLFRSRDRFFCVIIGLNISGIRLAGEKSDLESSSLHEELVAEKAFERLYEKLEANGELMGQYGYF
jgi:hypothetical protein